MPRRKKKEDTHLTPEGVFKSDKYEWCPPGFFALKFTDILARSAIQQYANLVMRRDPQLYHDLTAAVEAAGGIGVQELEAACRPPDAPASDHICVVEGCAPHDHGDASAIATPCRPAQSPECVAFLFEHPQPVNGVTRPACDEHEWVDVKNEAVASGQVCPHCGAIRG